MENEILNSNDQKDSSMSLKDLIVQINDWIGYLFSKWLIILIFGLTGGAIGFLYAYNQKTIYSAQSTFVLEEGGGGSGSSLGQYAGLASMVGIDLGVGGSNGMFQGDNILELYKSRKMLEATLLSDVIINGKKQKLVDKYIEFNGLRKVWDLKDNLRNIKFNNYPFSRIQDSVLNFIVGDINKNYLIVNRPNKKLSIIMVTVKAIDEAFAKSFNDELVRNVNSFYIETKTKKSLENLKILQHQTDSVKAVLTGSIFAAAATIDATPNLNPTRLILRAPAQKSQFNAEANKAILTELVKNLELSKITLRKETPLLQIIDQPVEPLPKEKIGKAISIIVGGILFGVLIVLFLIVKKVLAGLV